MQQPISVSEYTEQTIEGNGVFDQMMKATTAHLEQEFTKNRIKGPEYSQVYLGAMQSVMDRALQFLLQQQTVHLQAQLLEEQIVGQQKENALQDARLAQIQAETSLTGQQESNLQAEALNIPKQGEVLDKQVEQAVAEISRISTQESLIAEQTESEAKQNEIGGVLDKQIAQLGAETSRIEQQTINLTEEAKNIPKQGLLIDQQIAESKEQVIQIGKQTLQIEQQTSNLAAEALNIPKQGELIDKRICNLQAEFDLLGEQITKTAKEQELLTQRVATEKAQTDGTGIDPTSVVGRQNELQKNQADGFIRDAEQKAAKLMVDTWNVRRTTDNGESANDTNKLRDPFIGDAIQRLLNGVNA